MEKFDKWFLPSGEQHLQQWMKTVGRRVDGRLTYQYGKYEAALPFCKQRRVALDIGAHVGLWSYFMARDFEHVAGFEPIEEHQQCWHMNLKDKPNAELFTFALGNYDGKAAMHCRTEGSSGDTQIKEGGAGDFDIAKLDGCNVPFVDFIKVDCEGYELNVLLGAEKTLLAWKPCIVVEQKGNMIEKYGGAKLGAVDYLKTLGARVKQEISGDFIMAWDEAGEGQAHGLEI